MSDSQFGQLLKHLRVARGATLSEVAEGTGVSVPMVSRMERGERLPSTDTLATLARYFEVSEDVLTDAVVAQHVQNRYPRSNDSLRRGRVHSDEVTDRSGAHEEAFTALHLVSPIHNLEPPAEKGPATPEPPSPHGYTARPIAALFGEANEPPVQALEDAAAAAEAALRQLVREFRRADGWLDAAERERMDHRIAALREALARLGR